MLKEQILKLPNKAQEQASQPKGDMGKIFFPVHRIIPFSNVEGIGNRCSIFLQGCNINCLYCHNPETIPFHCDQVRKMNLLQLLEEIKKSMPFIRGITVSGGEPTLHFQALTELFKAVKVLGLTCYLDSNGYFDFDKISSLIEHTDKFLFDIKGLGTGYDKLCFDYQNKAGSESTSTPALNSKLKEKNLLNLKRLLELDKVEEVRLVHIKSFYNVRETLQKIAETIKDYPHVMFKFIRVHAKGARDERYISKVMPSLEEHQALAEYFKTLCSNPLIKID